MGRPPALGRACVGICLWAAGALAIAAEDPADIYKKILPAINLLLLGDRAIELTITSPVAGTGTTQSAVTVTGTVKGPAGVTIQATNTGAAGTFKGVVAGDPASSAGATYKVANVALGLGSNTITVTASHSSQSPVQKTVAVTRLALPTVQITSPVNGAVVEASPVTVMGTFTSASSITVNGQVALLNNPAPGQFSATGVTLTGSANGAANTVTATAIQVEAKATSAVSVTFVTDPRVEWVLEVPAASSYEVLARWVVIAGNNAAASYTVHHAGGSTTVTRNQQQGGGQWVSLGIFDLAPGVNHRVELRPSAGGAVVADAVRIVSQTETIVHNIYTDHLDTPRLITDQANQAVWRWDNDEPFGGNSPDENPSGLGTFEFPLGLSGYYRDKETGNFYAYFRDCYDPATGRFCQSDPIGLAGGINTYTYVTSNPLGFMDPYGLEVLISGHVAVPYSDEIGLGSRMTPQAFHLSLILVRDSDGQKTVISGQGVPRAHWTPFGWTSDLMLETRYGLKTDDFPGSRFLQVVPTPAGQDDCTFIENIKRAAAAYQNSLRYSFPGQRTGFMGPGTYNSNSWIAGILIAAGATPPPLNTSGRFQAPGYMNPIPVPSFQGTLDCRC